MLELSNLGEKQIDRAKMEDLLKQKFFYDMSFSIYGGLSLYIISVGTMYVVIAAYTRS